MSTKIYNEILIDMNPESSDYGETIHEDSFQHDGEMALLQNGTPDYTYPDDMGSSDTSISETVMEEDFAGANLPVSGFEGFDGSNSYTIWDSHGNKHEVRWDMGNFREAGKWYQYTNNVRTNSGHKNKKVSTLKQWTNDKAAVVGGGDIFYSEKEFADSKYNVAKSQDWGAYGLKQEDFFKGKDIAKGEKLSNEEVFEMLKDEGAIHKDELHGDWAVAIQEMPWMEEVSQEDIDEYEADLASDISGYEKTYQDIAGGGAGLDGIFGTADDQGTAWQDYYKLETEKLGDIEESGGEARSDIYGLLSGAGEEKRAGMFGEGLGGGITTSRERARQRGLTSSGDERLGLLQQNVGDWRQDITNAATRRETEIGKALGIKNQGLYGLLDTGEIATEDTYRDASGNIVSSSGVYGLGGSGATAWKDITDKYTSAWETDWEDWLGTTLTGLRG